MTEEWSIPDVTYSGNPIDVLASVAFTHAESGNPCSIDLFYDGDDIWQFRFSGRKTGQWSFATT